MEESRARRVVTRLRDRDVFAHLKLPSAGRSGYAVRIVLADGREALWGDDGSAALKAQVMRDGVLVGFVDSIPGSEDYTDDQIVDAIAAADYDRPIGRSVRPAVTRRVPPSSPPPTLAERWRGFLG
ncbi:hypothetical protein FHR83_000266 [Actinoplanes campanulatus]|uniref:Uncharacterized protein n=1 Tax=Actinoplanes campanulatus TaxID=113559 RepID=A0A7W5AAS8_9ACTN|nr:hypothetical protein [Actinoplanes campanulatus]MBB3092632.1 hypothetical protein [Actinoplanes campanulatus]GGM97890.1 hypothetical protein GCM10010109_01930 [Actinoplanes campanulatus]GID34272.1 hypothetical protein Aca09nite_07780 [Actinoplanes campanulatus]